MLPLADKENDSYNHQTFCLMSKKESTNGKSDEGDVDGGDNSDKKEFNCMKIVIDDDGNSAKKGNMLVLELLLIMMVTITMSDLNSLIILMMMWNSLITLMITEIIEKFVITANN